MLVMASFCETTVGDSTANAREATLEATTRKKQIEKILVYHAEVKFIKSNTRYRYGFCLIFFRNEKKVHNGGNRLEESGGGSNEF